MILNGLLYTLSMDVKTAHFSDEQTVNNINRGKYQKFCLLDLIRNQFLPKIFETQI